MTPPPERRKSYFAYGTLLDLATMRRAAPSAEPEGILRLEGYRLGFARCADGVNGGCTLVPELGAFTFGVLYRLSAEDRAALDRSALAEDDSLWIERPIRARDTTGKMVETSTYVIPGSPPALAPDHAYVQPILKGLAALELPADYVAMLIDLIAAARASRTDS